MRTQLLAACLALALTACETAPLDPSTEPDSTEDVQAALAALPGVEVLGTHADGVPYMIRGQLGSVGTFRRGFSPSEAHAHISAALANITPVFRLKAPELVVRRLSVDEQGHTHIRYDQTKNGLPVVGHELIVHVDPNGTIYAANGSARDGEHLAFQARIAPESARVVALGATPGEVRAEQEPRLVYIRSSADDRLKLAFEVLVTGEHANTPVRDHVFVDALTGSLLERSSDIHHALNRVVYSANNGTTLPGTLRRGEGGASTGDTVVDKAYENLGVFYNCFKTNFGLDSYNGAGAQLRTSVHYGMNYVNAFWDGSLLVCGDGDGFQSGPLCNDMDVVNHEFTHAVTSSKSNLTYMNESGALSESLSDIFSAYCESWSTTVWSMGPDVWKIGEDMWTPGTAGDALRDMSNPALDGSSKDYYSERYTGTADNGGVHSNSGIVNLVFHLLSQGGTHPRGKTTITVPGIGIQKAGTLFYKASSDYFTSSTTFAQAKTATEQAAAVYYGVGSFEQLAVTKAWEAVGLAVLTGLTNGVAMTNLSGAAGSQTYYVLNVPAGAANVMFETSGGSGDMDLYVRYNLQPDSLNYDCRPFLGGNTEGCNIPSPSAGSWYAMLNGFTAYSGVSLKGTVFSRLNDGIASATMSGAQGSERYWALEVPSGMTRVTFTLAGVSGNTGDADLYVRNGRSPTLSAFDCRPYIGGNSEVCTFDAPAAGTWYVMVRGWSAYSGVTVTGDYY